MIQRKLSEAQKQIAARRKHKKSEVSDEEDDHDDISSDDDAPITKITSTKKGKATVDANDDNAKKIISIPPISKYLENKVIKNQYNKCAKRPYSRINGLEKYHCRLWKGKNGEGTFIAKDYTIIKVNNHEPVAAYNLIALCESCFKVLQKRKTHESAESMKYSKNDVEEDDEESEDEESEDEESEDEEETV